jgi:hypothetical protein
MTRASKRKGICSVITRHCKANHAGLSDYDPELENVYICDLDIRSMYASMLLKPLPVDSFVELEPLEIASFDPMIIDEFGEHGYLISADIEYPIELHDYLSQLPPLPAKMTLSKAEISELQKEFLSNPIFLSNVEKEQVFLDLYNKSNYCLFLHMLKQCIRLGLRIVKYNDIYRFRQAAFAEPHTTELLQTRREAQTIAENLVAKLHLNGFYGYTGIDQSLFRDIKICTETNAALKYIEKKNFKSFRIVNESMTIVELGRTSFVNKNNVLVQAAVLDMSKALIYKVVYAFIDKFGDRFKLLYIDTDGFKMSLKTNNVYGDLSSVQVDNEPIVDMSFLPPTHEYYSTVIAGRPGKLTSEVGTDYISEYVGLKKKTYALKLESLEGNISEKLRSKGVPRAYQKQSNFHHYKETLFNKTSQRIPVYGLRSFNLQIYQVLVNRLALSPVSDSRFLIPPFGVESLPYGHYSLRDRVRESVAELPFTLSDDDDDDDDDPDYVLPATHESV